MELHGRMKKQKGWLLLSVRSVPGVLVSPQLGREAEALLNNSWPMAVSSVCCCQAMFANELCMP